MENQLVLMKPETKILLPLLPRTIFQRSASNESSSKNIKGNRHAHSPLPILLLAFAKLG